MRGWVARAAALAVLVLAAAGPGARADVRPCPPEVRELLGTLRGQVAVPPVFSESFSTDLRQWGMPTLLGPRGLVLDRSEGTVPGARQIFVPGLMIRDGLISCELRLAADDQGYVVFRCDEEGGVAYQFLVTTRLDGSYTTGFVRKHNLEQLYGGGQVGECFRAAYAPEQWLHVEVFLSGRRLLAAVDGQPAAYYDRAEARDGSLSVLAGGRPLQVRSLSFSLFRGGVLPAPYRLARAARPAIPEPRAPARPLDDRPAFFRAAVPLPGPPQVRVGAVEGTVRDAAGAVHRWRLDADGRFSLDLERLIPLRDGDGVYFAQVPAGVEEQRAVESIRDDRVIASIRAAGLPFMPVRVRLADYVNALATDHEFSEEPVLGGRSRILEIAGRRYRVTSARRWLSYFAYTLRTDAPRTLHLLLADAPNDRERYLTLRIHPPDNQGADPDYGVGAGSFTGRWVPCDGQPSSQMLLFRPRSERVRFTVSRMPAEEAGDASNGAAVAQVFLFALVDPLADRPNPVLPPDTGPERTLALSVPSARVLLRQQGTGLESIAASPADRATGYRSFLHLLRFVGCNALDLGVLDTGAGQPTLDYSGSRVLSGGLDRGIFSTLLPLAADAGIRVTPVIPPVPLTRDLAGVGNDPELWSLVGRDETVCRIGGWPVLDSLHPDAGQVATRLVAEVAALCRESPAVREVALRVDGDVGGCFPAAGRLRAEEVGYGAAVIARFASETGLAVPNASAQEAYEWLRANAWERWIDWRCRKLQAAWLRSAAALREVRMDSPLLLKVALPDHGPARAEAWFEEKADPLDLLRAHGFDPRLFAFETRITVERSFSVGYDRVRSYSHRENSGALDSYEYQKGLAAHFQGAGPEAVEIALAPWEEYGQRLGSEFYPVRGGHWGASTVTARGRALFRPLTHLMRVGNPCRLSLHSAEFATAGREHDWRRFARAYRALPAVRPEPFAGTAALRAPAAGPLPADLVIAAFADRIGIVNDSAQARQIELRPERVLLPGERWVDLATGRTFAPGAAGALILDLEPYDLRALAVLRAPVP